MHILFARLLNRIKPTDAEVTRARVHAATIRSRLEKNFDLVRVVNIGSHSRDTAIRHYSDLDLLAVFSRDDARWGDGYKSSNTFLRNIRDDLGLRYQSTGVRGDGQAVVIEFGGGHQPVDVVPAIYEGPGSGNYPLYLIPSGDGNWLRTSPALHNKYLSEENERSGGKLKGVIKLMKYWRVCRTPVVPLSSFHLELLLASERICTGVKSYGQCLADAFYLIASREGRGYRDPLGISGVVEACGTQRQREVLESAASYATQHADLANAALKESRPREAARQWDIVFNGMFPKLPA